MVRKTKQEAEQTRVAILDAAELAFSEHGVSRTSLETVARRAGVTRGAVYWHFSNKLDLFAALMERFEMPLFEQFERTIGEQLDDPLPALHRSVLHAIDEMLTNPSARRMIDILWFRCEYVGELAPVLERHDSKTAWFIDQSQAVFERAQALGKIDASLSPLFCARLYHSLVTGIFRDWLFTQQADVDVRALAGEMLHHMLDSFRPRPA